MTSMTSSMEVFTINGKLTEGARIELCHMKEHGIIIPGIQVHSDRNIVPVILGSWEKLMLGVGRPEELRYAMVGSTSSGRPLLFKMDRKTTDEAVIVMFRTVEDGHIPVPSKTLARESIGGSVPSGAQLLAIVEKGRPFLTVENGIECVYCWTGGGFTRDTAENQDISTTAPRM